MLAVSRAWTAALTSNDALAVGRFMTDDGVYVDPSGATTKADALDGSRPGASQKTPTA
ncbi:MAG TPA: DUF4440 domain-containing protein [Jatrophihabitans sp.]|nr:DUF4440 domain-containing protein [Jatrophihabitans sp.]